ncbi:MAG: PadR family transcriptional regulator [Acholeplasmataceae bacterium]|nr:PadR family transcriptional regulator [Acholeplasmataceae bacterium]
MKVQLKKGLLDICVLAALLEEESYGYKLIQDTGEVIEMSESTLYPILRRLEENHYLESYHREHNGRLRKYYRITAAGIANIKRFLEDWEGINRVYEFIKEKMRNEEK